MILCLITLQCSAIPNAVIKRIPDGPIVESDKSNITLQCGLESSSASVNSVIWFFNGVFLKQIPDELCEDFSSGSGSGSGDYDEIIDESLGEFIDHEIGSGHDLNEEAKLFSEDIISNFRVKRQISDSDIKELEVGNDYDEHDYYDDLEANSGESGIDENDSGSGSGEETDPMMNFEDILCDVDPSILILQDVSRQFSGEYSCSVLVNNVPSLMSKPLKIDVEFAPEKSFVTSTHVTHLEGEIFSPVFCDGEANPPPDVSWSRNEEVISNENTLDFVKPVSRVDSGEYTCHISNIHGATQISLNVDVLFKPQCEIRSEIVDEELILTCSAHSNPKEVTFLWVKDNIRFEGQNNPDVLETTIRLKTINESTGVYSCLVRNEVGEGECLFGVTEDVLAGDVGDLILIFIVTIIIVMIVVIISAILCYLCWRRRQKQSQHSPAAIQKDTSKSFLLKDEQNHADPEFYENLPFNKLRNPPKQVVDDDMLDYADVDYLDIYTNGPLKYREASEKNATLRKKKLEERQAVKSALL